MKKKLKFIFKKWKAVPTYIKWPAVVMSALIIVALIGYSVLIYGGRFVVDKADLILDTKSTIETQDGDVLAELYHENRTYISEKEIPEHVKNAFIAIEDRRFYKHSGVDVKSGIRAVFKDVLAMGKVEGASTITQQLAKNVFLTSDKTWMRKTKEMMASIYLERHYSKKEILELYLNQMYFGDGVYGVETASQHFFQKSVKDLTTSEGALLAGLAKAPNGYSPTAHPKKATERRNVVLKAMENAGMMDTESRVEAQGKTLGLNIADDETNHVTDSYVDLVTKEAAKEHQLSIDELQRGGYLIVVNLDEEAQQIAYRRFQNGDYFPGNTAGTQGAFVMMDQQNGGIVAAIGGRDYKLGEWNRTAVKRQPGSTMKPLAVYGPALMREKYQPFSLLQDKKKDYDGYTATNIDGQYAGDVSMYQALVESKNAPAVWLLDQLGVDDSKSYLDKMGIQLPDTGLSIALGGLKEGLTPVDMVQGYGTFAHNGKMVKAHTIDRIYKRNQSLMYRAKSATKDVFSKQTSWDMTQMLSSVVTDGTGQAGEYPKALAGKTGTTQHPHAKGQVKDAWFVGYTPEYTTALWMGYDDADKDHFLTGGSEYPTKLTKAILSDLDERKPLKETFTKPNGVKALPKPIKLPDSTHVSKSYAFGGLSIVKGKLTWDESHDDRIQYHVYRIKDGESAEKVDTVKGNQCTVDIGSIFSGETSFYVVPYDSLTHKEGKRSNYVTFSR